MEYAIANNDKDDVMAKIIGEIKKFINKTTSFDTLFN